MRKRRMVVLTRKAAEKKPRARSLETHRNRKFGEISQSRAAGIKASTDGSVAQSAFILRDHRPSGQTNALVFSRVQGGRFTGNVAADVSRYVRRRLWAAAHLIHAAPVVISGPSGSIIAKVYTHPVTLKRWRVECRA